MRRNKPYPGERMKQTVFVFAVVLLLAAVVCPSTSNAESDETTQVVAQDNSEIAELFNQDQADRRPPEGGVIDWPAVTARDRDREKRVKNLFGAGALKTGRDYYHAAMVFMHSNASESHLLAHELSIVAAIKGEPKAKWLIAASEDRFLMNIGRPQRFGTQYRSLSPDTPMTLHELDGTVTDQLRLELNVPTLDEARERERAMTAPKARAN